MKRGFRGQAIYLVQSPPILGDLGSISRRKRSDEDLCVHSSLTKWGEALANPSPQGEGLESCSLALGKGLVQAGGNNRAA